MRETQRDRHRESEIGGERDKKQGETERSRYRGGVCVCECVYVSAYVYECA